MKTIIDPAVLVIDVPLPDPVIELGKGVDDGHRGHVGAAEPADVPLNAAFLVSALNAGMAVESVKPVVGPEQQPPLVLGPLPAGAVDDFHDRVEGQAPEYRRWTSVTAAPSRVRDAVSLMDRRIWQAITTGSVDLPQRRVHAGIWFRLLRTLLDELSAVEAQCGRRQLAEIRLLWEYCGYPFRAGLLLWRPFETLPWPTQQQLLEATALFMELIEAGTLTALGTSAHLLLPESDRKIIDGTQPVSSRKPAS